MRTRQMDKRQTHLTPALRMRMRLKDGLKNKEPRIILSSCPKKLKSLGKVLKKIIESLTAVKPEGRGGQWVGGHSPKIYFVFTPNFIYHILSKLFDPIDLTSHPWSK